MYVNFVFNTVHIIDTISENFNSKLEKIHFIRYFCRKTQRFCNTPSFIIHFHANTQKKREHFKCSRSYLSDYS